MLCFIQLYDIAKAKEDHSDRVGRAESIKADIAKTLNAVFDANEVLQVKNINVNFNSNSIICLV